MSRRLRHDDGAILVIALVVITTVALVVGAVLTRGDGSLRATVTMREAAGSTYAADGAASIVINDLRTGHWAGSSTKPSDWAFNNATGTGCFGYNTDGSTVDGLELPAFYPAPRSSGDGPTSAYVACTAEDATGAQGSAVPITSGNKPGNAILTLGTGGENGFTFKTNGSGGAFRVRGGIWSNSNIFRDNNGTLESTESIRAHSGCAPVSAMSAPRVDCAAGTAPDPGYPSDLEVAGTGVPALQIPPSSCSGSVTLQPGYYDDASKLNALTPNGGSNCMVHLRPGTYYFDFHNGTSAGSYDMTTSGSANHVWNVNSGTIVGGTLTSDTEVPGRCVSPINDVSANGVQLIFGGDSRIVVDKGAQMEVCASYRSSRPPIAVYGQKTGTAVSTTVNGSSALTTAGTPIVTPSTFTGATAANLQTADGVQATNANLAVWARDSTGGNNQAGSITMTGFAPATALPKGTILTGARLKITHRSTGSPNGFTLTPATGAGLGSFTLPARTALTTDDVDLSTVGGWAALQRSVHDNGYAGATLKFDASLGKNQVAQLDAARLELTYVLPALRAQTNTVAAPGGEPFVKALGNSTLFYVQGTSYAPLASINLELNNIAESVFRFGVVARALSIFETGSFAYPGAVIELPDNSPGWGFNGTLVQLEVYVCPDAVTCAPDGTPDLTSRVQLWDTADPPVPSQRQITVLSWSHQR